MATYIFGSTADSLVTTACGILTASGSSVNKSNKVAKNSGWGTLWSQGNTGAWAGGASETAFGDVHGWILDDTSLEGMTIKAGTWTSVSVKLAASASGITATPILRIGVRHSDGTFTEIASCNYGSRTLPTTAATITGTATQATDQPFVVGDKLYVQLDLDITSNAGGSNTATVNQASLNVSGSNSMVSPSIVSSGSTFNDSGSGPIALSGSGSESLTSSATASGTITFSGSGVESYQPPGATYTDSGVGTITLSGARTESSSHNSIGTGSVTLSGSRAESAVFVSSAVGSITLSGSGVETFIGPVVHADSGLGSISLSGSSTETYTWGGGASLKPFLLMHHSGLARLENIRQWLTTNTSYTPHNGSLREIESWLGANPISGKECTPYNKAGTDEFWAIEEFLLEISGSGG